MCGLNSSMVAFVLDFWKFGENFLVKKRKQDLECKLIGILFRMHIQEILVIARNGNYIDIQRRIAKVNFVRPTN